MDQYAFRFGGNNACVDVREELTVAARVGLDRADGDGEAGEGLIVENIGVFCLNVSFLYESLEGNMIT